MIMKASARNVLARFVERVGMEHDTPEAMAKYLKEHPGADKSKHTVKKDKGEDSGKGSEAGPSSKDAKKALKSSLEGEKSKARLNKMKDQLERAKSYRHNDPAKVREVAGRMVEEDKRHLQNAEEALKHIESLPGKVDKRDVKELEGMVKEMKASLERHEDAVSRDNNYGWAGDISDDSDRLQHALTTALYKIRSGS